MENEETDIKPLLDISESNTAKPSNSNNSTITKKWSPGSWQDGNRQSAFQPYKQQQQQTSLCTVLTNLQRGNTQADTPVPQSIDINFHTRAGKGEITQEYIRKEKCIDLLDNNDLTPLHWAAAYGQTNSVQLLLLNGAQIDQIGPEGETPLLLAANGGHHDIVKILINKKADVNKVDDVGNTALMYAASGNHPHCCYELLSNGADFTVSNYDNKTAYDLAVENGSSLAKAVIENHLLTILGG